MSTQFSNIKKDDILEYIKKKLNQNTQDVIFTTGIDGMPLYKPMTEESAEGKIDGLEFFDENTYQRSKKDVVPYSVPVLEGDYANLKTMEQTKQIRSSSWSVALSFLVYTGSYVHNKLLFSIEEFRDKLLGNFDLLEVYEFDYKDENAEGQAKLFNVVTTASDVVAGGLLTIKGDKYLEYVLRIDLDIGEDIAYGNQFEFYIRSKTNPKERVLPIQASFGASNSLVGAQLLKNPNLTGEVLKRSQMVHNIIASRGWAINFTFLFQRGSPIVKELFKEGFAMKEKMNNVFEIEALFKYKSIDVEGVETYVYDNDLKFTYPVVVGEISTDIVHGDDIIFGIGFALSWGGFENGIS